MYPKITSVAHKICNISVFWSKSTRNVCLFSVFNFECPACYCRAMEQYIFSLMLRGLSEWRGMVMFIEYLIAEKESVTNIDKQLKNVYGVTAVSCWAHKFQVLRKAECLHCFGLPTTAAFTQVLLQCADELMQNS
jgi:hypothetical protein